ncbi:polysaccharide lyase beta-sandwich domain-containing protein [Vibrio mexicanus]|uniref:polysaccharide lyase beta-sandwich domain-containing protein n=1 Tax=Vibrio mexicanus TaxID=1004326 RepID=UPI001EE325DA|nr:polysaccharide lyase beta-sandwich domain-containing protein [Vibrio mexicanus]
MGHSWQPTSASYAYQIVPEKTATETASYAQSNPVQILTNTDKVQAVYHTGLNTTGIVFYQAGSLTLANGAVVTVDKPSVLVVDSSQVQPQITLSTPGYGTQVKVSYSGGGLDLVTSVVTSALKAELGKSHSVDFSNPVIEPQQLRLWSALMHLFVTAVMQTRALAKTASWWSRKMAQVTTVKWY